MSRGYSSYVLINLIQDFDVLYVSTRLPFIKIYLHVVHNCENPIRGYIYHRVLQPCFFYIFYIIYIFTGAAWILIDVIYTNGSAYGGRNHIRRLHVSHSIWWRKLAKFRIVRRCNSAGATQAPFWLFGDHLKAQRPCPLILGPLVMIWFKLN